MEEEEEAGKEQERDETRRRVENAQTANRRGHRITPER